MTPALKKYSFIWVPLCLFLWIVLWHLPFLKLSFLGADEGWYLYAGHQLLLGHWPYVDFFDRKPVGLFLLYAFFDLFGTKTFWIYQVFALLSVWVTSLFLYKMLRLTTDRLAGFFGALLYSPLLFYSGGHAGQSPVFYNSLTIFAFYLILSHLEPLKTGKANLCRYGAFAMLLFGLALQLKYTAVFEGVFLGCFLLRLAWQKQETTSVPLRLFLTACMGALWIFAALLPTLGVFLFYQAHHFGQEWIFANFYSGLLRTQHISKGNLHHALKLLTASAIIFGALLFLLKNPPRKLPAKKSEFLSFLLLWDGIALFAALILGEWHDHYFLPFFVPFCLSCGILFSEHFYKILLLLALLFGWIAFGHDDLDWYRENSLSAKEIEAVSDKISKNGTGCLWNITPFTFLSEILPQKSCALSKIAFGPHWRDEVEFSALGLSLPKTFEQVKQIRPHYVLTSGTFNAAVPRTESEKLQRDIFSFLQKDYQPFLLWNPHQTETPLWILWQTKRGIAYDRLPTEAAKTFSKIN